MPLWIVAQIGSPHELFEVAAMIVDIAGHPHFAFGGEIHHLLIAERTQLILFRSSGENLDRLLSG